MFFVVAYRFYGAFIAAKVLTIDDRRITPAIRLEDGKDFHPTHTFVLFGHHLAAIAGAGPLIGPVLAALPCRSRPPPFVYFNLNIGMRIPQCQVGQGIKIKEGLP